MLLFPQDTSGHYYVLDVPRTLIGASLVVVGTITKNIVVSIPLIEHPDDTNAAHWQPLTCKGTDVVISPTTMSFTFDGALGLIRIVKDAGDDCTVKLER